MGSMGCGLRVRPRLRQSLEARLTLEQRNVIALRVLQRRFDLIESVYGERYEPHANCPKCGRSMNPLEIIRGFNADPNDFTTACTGCGTRFEAMLVCKSDYFRIELPFYCSAQTLSQLPGKERIAIDVFKKEHPAIYHSAVVHHGGLRQAFEKIGIQYSFDELRDWQDRVKQFLGELPDTVIASCLGKPVRAIRNLRKRLHIPPCQTRKYALQG